MPYSVYDLSYKHVQFTAAQWYLRTLNIESLLAHMFVCSVDPSELQYSSVKIFFVLSVLFCFVLHLYILKYFV